MRLPCKRLANAATLPIPQMFQATWTESATWLHIMLVKLTIEVPAELVAALRDDKASSIQKVAALDAIKLAAQNVAHDAAPTAQPDAQATENAPSPGPPSLDTSKEEPARSTDTGAFQVFLRNLNGSTTVLMVSNNMTVQRLKREIFNTGEVAPMFQRLRLLSGRILGDTDDDITLEEVHLQYNSFHELDRVLTS